MAQRIVVDMTDDLDGSPAEETVRFGLDGTAYEIDLSAGNVAKFRNTLGVYTDLARTVRGTNGRKPPRSLAQRNESAKIREWAGQNGIVLATRGRIPESVAADYRKAQESPAPVLVIKQPRAAAKAPGNGSGKGRAAKPAAGRTGSRGARATGTRRGGRA